ERELDEVFAVLQHVELEVVLAQHADAVDVALGKILELRRFFAELEQDLKTIERALELADLLEVVGDLFELALALDQRAARFAGVRIEPHRGEAVVEVYERRFVWTVTELGVVQELTPRGGGFGVLLRTLE